jgi:hypothetical protein
MGNLTLVKNSNKMRQNKKRETKIDKYNLVNKVINYLADNKSYAFIAKQLVQYVRTRKVNPDEKFSINQQTVKVWWMENVSTYGEILNQKRSALAEQRHRRYLDKGVKVRENVQDQLNKDAEKALQMADSSFGVEAAARIREKVVKVQESGERAIATQTPNLNLTTININPLNEFSEKMSKKLDELEEEENNTLDIEFEEAEYEDIPVEEELDDEEDDEQTGDAEGNKKRKKE